MNERRTVLAELVSRYTFLGSVVAYITGAIALWKAASLLSAVLAMVALGIATWLILRRMRNDRSFDWGTRDILEDRPVQEMRKRDIAEWKARWHASIKD
ncbi:hypothetical protein [Ralstonia pickettii]|uniref:hypothetical protein n=1 Tax=Ralstonia pickettii TaxID=329 RepID=UPI002D78D065|nr:hypothetical protein [Ralstonia pickettii]MCL6482933.1 hypothetical protein [Janthinobacterium lividum]